jgi:hypothetical protein
MRTFFRSGYAKLREINRTYAIPTIEMSGPVKAALMILRLYLIVLIGLTLYKFVTLVK